MDNECMIGTVSKSQLALLSDPELMRILELRARGCKQASMTARLAAVIELVEGVFARGYGRSQVRDILIETGWHFTLDSFDSALSRVRGRRLGFDSAARRSDRPIDVRPDKDGQDASDEQSIVSAKTDSENAGRNTAPHSDDNTPSSLGAVLLNGPICWDPLKWR